MATVTWLGTTDGDWNTGTNWSTGSAPDDGDTVIFNASSRDVTISSSVDSLTYAALKVLDGFTGSLGTQGSPLVVNATNLFLATDGAQTHLDGDYSTGHVSDTPGGVGISFGSNSTFGTLRVTGGDGTVQVSSSTLTTVQVVGAFDIRLEVLAAAASFGTLIQDSGTVQTAESITTADVSGGVLELTTNAGVTTLNLTGSGSCRHNSTGTITTANVFDRSTVLDLSANSTGTGATVTDVNLYDGEVNERNGAGNATFTNGIQILGAGVIKADVARILTVS